MKKSICLFLLLLAATFQVAWSESSIYPFSENKPCEGESNIDWVPFVVSFEKECNGKTCYVIVEFYTKTYTSPYYGSMYGYEITGIGYSDENSQDCECSEESIISEAVTKVTEWLVQNAKLSKDNTIFAASIKKCYYKDVAELNKESLQKELEKTESALPPYLRGVPVGGSQKQIYTCEDKIKLRILRPCGQEKCCIAVYKIIWTVDDNFNMVYGGFTFSSYDGEDGTFWECNEDFCKDACIALKVDCHLKVSEKTQTLIVPSPNNGSFTAYITPLKSPAEFVIYSSLGNEVYRVPISPSTNSTTLNVELKCQSGTYIFKIIENGVSIETGNLRIIK